MNRKSLQAQGLRVSPLMRDARAQRQAETGRPHSHPLHLRTIHRSLSVAPSRLSSAGKGANRQTPPVPQPSPDHPLTHTTGNGHRGYRHPPSRGYCV